MIHFKDRKLVITLSAIGLIPICFVIYFLYFFELAPGKKDLLASFTLVGSKDRIEIYSYRGGATTKDNVQMLRIDEHDKKSTIKVIENYAIIKRLKFLSNSSFEVVLGDEYFPEIAPTDSVITVKLSYK